MQRQIITLFDKALDRKVFAEVLYPNDIYDLIDCHLRECIKRETRLGEDRTGPVLCLERKGQREKGGV